MADEAEIPAGVKIGRRPSGVLAKTAGVARERVLRYGISFIFSLKMYIFRVKMRISTLKICIFRLEMAVFNLKMFILSVKIRLISYMSKPFS